MTRNRPLLDGVRSVAAETARVMNLEIARLCLNGVTAWDIQKGDAATRRLTTAVYLKTERDTAVQEKPEQLEPSSEKTKNIWALARGSIQEPRMADDQLLAKYCLTRRKGLRLITNLIQEVLGNFSKKFYGVS